MTAVTYMTLAEIRAADAEMDAAAGPGHPASALKAEAQSPRGVAVAGTDGYLFIGNGANRWERQFLGELAIEEAWFAGWARIFEMRRAEAERRGLPLWNFVAPEKQAVYGDKRWPQGVDSSRRPLRQLLERLGPDAAVVYPEAELVAGRALGPVYFRHNSHWTASGCCIAGGAQLAALGLQTPIEKLRFGIRRTQSAHDLTVHFFDPAPEEEALFVAPPGEVIFEHRQVAETGRRTGTTYGLRNRSAPDSRTLILFGDSFSYDAGFAAALSVVFANVVFIWSKHVVWELVSEHGADVVLWQSAERFLTTLPQT